ncbi:MAG: hypothetical protein WC521_06870 [Bdellovibrionales bacterium]
MRQEQDPLDPKKMQVSEFGIESKTVIYNGDPSSILGDISIVKQKKRAASDNVAPEKTSSEEIVHIMLVKNHHKQKASADFADAMRFLQKKFLAACDSEKTFEYLDGTIGREMRVKFDPKSNIKLCLAKVGDSEKNQFLVACLITLNVPPVVNAHIKNNDTNTQADSNHITGETNTSAEPVKGDPCAEIGKLAWILENAGIFSAREREAFYDVVTSNLSGIRDVVISTKPSPPKKDPTKTSDGSPATPPMLG